MVEINEGIEKGFEHVANFGSGSATLGSNLGKVFFLGVLKFDVT